MRTGRSISRRAMLLGEAKARRRQTAPSVADHCLALAATACRTCEDACDVHAIQFQPRQGGTCQLSIDIDTCTGCGDCLKVCPVAALSFGEASRHEQRACEERTDAR